MNATEYRLLRRAIGSQADVARELGVAQPQISDRERGLTRISKTDEFALRWLHHQKAERAQKAAPAARPRPLSPMLRSTLVKTLREQPEVQLAAAYFDAGLGPGSWRGRIFRVVAHREGPSSSGVLVTIQGKPQSRKIEVDSSWLRKMDPQSKRLYPLVG